MLICLFPSMHFYALQRQYTHFLQVAILLQGLHEFGCKCNNITDVTL